MLTVNANMRHLAFWIGYYARWNHHLQAQVRGVLGWNVLKRTG